VKSSHSVLGYEVSFKCLSTLMCQLPPAPQEPGVHETAVVYVVHSTRTDGWKGHSWWYNRVFLGGAKTGFCELVSWR
jgi:hypothetical protein